MKRKMTASQLRAYLAEFAPNGVDSDLLQAYRELDRLLNNDRLTLKQAKAMSIISSTVAVAFTSITGRKIGEALGWDGVGHRPDGAPNGVNDVSPRHRRTGVRHG